MRARLASMVVVLVAIAGCRETHHCEPGWSFQNGECLPRSGQADSGPRPDAGMDGSTDAAIADVGNDAGHDGGPCDLCTADEMCLTSLPDAGADGGTISLPRCAQCVDDSQCAGARRVDGGLVDSGVDGGPAFARGTTICEGFRCVFGCHSDGDCGGNACRADHTCSAFGPGQGQCQPCDSEENCGATRDCVPMTFGPSATPIGSYCLEPVPAGACPGQYTIAIHHAGNDYCGVNQTLTTCEAVRLAFVTSCTVGTENPCGRDDIAGDGACRMITGLGPVCTYPCAGLDGTCPATRVCSGTPGVCGG